MIVIYKVNRLAVLGLFKYKSNKGANILAVVELEKGCHVGEYYLEFVFTMVRLYLDSYCSFGGQISHE